MAYERQYYTNGDVLDARQMNHMETGIKENSDNIDKLSEDIATKASAIKETASGEVIVVTDSDEAKPLGLAIDGKSEQNQYSGKNLYPYGDLSGNGGLLTEKPLVLPIGTYKFSMKTNVSSDIVTTIGFLDENKKGIINVGLANSHWYSSRNNTTINITSECKYISVYAREEITLSQIQIESGSEMTDYEPYCGGIPSPNPSYPQEIRNIGKYDEASGKYAVEVKMAHPLVAKVPMEQGAISSAENTYSQIKVASTARIRSVDIIPLENNKIKFEWNDAEYDLVYQYFGEDKIFRYSVGSSDVWYSNSPVIMNPTRSYFAFAIRRKYGTNITVEEFENVRLKIIIDGKETTATVYLDEPLRKGDKAYWNGGSKVRVDRNRVAKVLNGNENWTVSDITINGVNYKLHRTTLADMLENSHTSALVNSFIATTQGNRNVNTMSGFSTTCDFITDFGSTLDEWKAYLSENPIVVEYERATPITEEIDIDLDGLSMFYPTTIISNDCNANMEVTYIADTKAYIDKKFAELATAMV